MLVIRPEQLAALEQGMLTIFEDRVIAHLHELFPRSTSEYIPSEIRSLIRDGVTLAKRHGITRERDVVLFIDLMLALDREFDKLPKYQWASEILAEPGIPGTLKIERLYDELERINMNQMPDPEESL